MNSFHLGLPELRRISENTLLRLGDLLPFGHELEIPISGLAKNVNGKYRMHGERESANGKGREDNGAVSAQSQILHKSHLVKLGSPTATAWWRVGGKGH